MRSSLRSAGPGRSSVAAWEILLPGFAFSLLLVLSHTYFGLHVLARGIIFIDLALAQFAALGASIAFLAGKDVHDGTARGYAFTAAMAAALAFSMLGRIPGKTTREVIIGIAYVVATAVSILVLSRSVQGMEALKSLFNGSILWVGWNEVAVIGVIYGALGLVHLLFRDRFSALSFAYGEPGRAGLAWEFAFFATFAAVITLAVEVAGVLLVFAFLIIPAFCASMIAATIAGRLAAGWALGAAGSFAGLGLAYVADLPVGPTVVAVLGLLPILTVPFRRRG